MDNNEVIDEILNNFKTLNGIEDTEKDEIFKIYIEKAIRTILNLTNRETFPKQLSYVVLDMLSEWYLKDSMILDGISSDSDYVKSISEEGRSVSFGNTQETLLSSLLSNDISAKLNLRLKEINAYKLLYKTEKGN